MEVYKHDIKQFASGLIFREFLATLLKFQVCHHKSEHRWVDNNKVKLKFTAGLIEFNSFVTSGTYMSRLQRVFSSPLG
jgi:hypothetical protein